MTDRFRVTLTVKPSWLSASNDILPLLCLVPLPSSSVPPTDVGESYKLRSLWFLSFAQDLQPFRTTCEEHYPNGLQAYSSIDDIRTLLWTDLERRGRPADNGSAMDLRDMSL